MIIADLDAFVLSYCESHGIECDGDVFGLVFCNLISDGEPVNIEDASRLIEEAADLYGLRQ